MVVGESESGLGRRACCSEGFDMGRGSGNIYCELERGHISRFHRSDEGGFEWSGRELWPIPPGTTEGA